MYLNLEFPFCRVKSDLRLDLLDLNDLITPHQLIFKWSKYIRETISFWNVDFYRFWTGIEVETFPPAAASSDLHSDVTVFVSV